MSAELKEKQNVLNQLIEDNRKLNEALQISGKDCVGLREEIVSLRRSLNESEGLATKLMSEKEEAARFVASLSGVDIRDEVLQLNRDDLLRVAAAAGLRLQTLEKEAIELRTMVGDAKAVRLQLGNLQNTHENLQEAHMQQAIYIQGLQKSVSQLPVYRSTIETQEQVIAKLQSIVEQRLRGATSAGGVGDALKLHGELGEWMKAGDDRDREQVAAELDEERELERAALQEAIEECETLQSRISELEASTAERLAQAEANAKGRIEQINIKFEETAGQLQSVEAERDALDDQLKVQAHEGAKEVARLRARLFEIEIAQAISTDQDETKDFEEHGGFQFSHHIEGTGDYAGGVFGRDPSLGPISDSHGGSSSSFALAPHTPVPGLDLTSVNTEGNSAAGGGVNAALSILSAAAGNPSSSRAKYKVEKAARRASVMVNALGGGAQAQQLALALAAADVVDSDHGRSRRRRRTGRRGDSSPDESPRSERKRREQKLNGEDSGDESEMGVEKSPQQEPHDGLSKEDLTPEVTTSNVDPKVPHPVVEPALESVREDEEEED